MKSQFQVSAEGDGFIIRIKNNVRASLLLIPLQFGSIRYEDTGGKTATAISFLT